MDPEDQHLGLLVRMLQHQAERMLDVLEHPKRTGCLRVPPETRQDAERLLVCIDDLVERWDSIEAQTVLLAMEIGGLSERLEAAIGTPFAERGVPHFLKMRRKAQERGHPPEDIQAALDLFDRLVRENPTRKKHSIERAVAKETGISPRTLQRHRANRNP